MSIEEAILNFRERLIIETGVNDPVIKIGLSPEVFDRLLSDLYKKTLYGGSNDFYRSGELVFAGIQILPRVRDRF